MRFYKKTFLTACLLAAGLNGFAQDTQPRLDKEKAAEQVERAKEQVRNMPFEVPEEQVQKMRDAMSGSGDYALPQGSMEDSTMPERERKNMQKVLERMEEEKKRFKQQGLTEGFDEATQKKKMQGYMEFAQGVANQSQSGLEKALQEHANLNSQDAKAFVGRGDPTTEREQATESAIFASFSMTDDALRQVFVRAKQQDAEVYFKGMHSSHTKINETMQMVRRIGQGIDKPPMTRLNPKAFEKYGVTQVPTILYRDEDSYAKASGILNLGWVKEKAEGSEEDLSLGSFGPTSEVTERSILEVFKERLAKVDWEQKKRDAKAKFWKKKDFHTLPKAQEDKTFYIDPTVRAQSDIKTPDDRVLARKGEVVNPLKGRSMGVTMLIFDARDNKQVEWVAKQLGSGQLEGQVMVMTTQIQRKKGWDHLQALHDHFKRRIFVMPKEMVHKFQLTGAPAIVSTELEKELMKVQQFKL